MGIRGGREQDLVGPALELLALRGCHAWRNNSGALKVGGRLVRFGVKGSSDVLGLLPGGRFLAVELKKPGGRLTKDQKAFLANVAAKGGLAVVAKDLAELDALIKAAMR